MLSAALFFLPLLTAGGGLSPQEQEELPSATLPIDRAVQTAAGERDKNRMVKLLQEDGTVAELTMSDYLFGVVAAEMPAAFEEEALKAQACAARTYTVGKQGRTTRPTRRRMCARTSTAARPMSPGRPRRPAGG